MTLRHFSILLLLVATITSIFGASKPVLEEEARIFLRDANQRIYKAFEDLEDYQFDSPVDDAEEIFKRKVNAYKTIEDVVRQIKNYPYEQFHDEQLKREIHILKNSIGLYVLDKDSLENVEESLQKLKHMAVDANLCEYNNPNLCTTKYLPNVRHIYSESHDPNELKHYWIEWRNHNSRNAAKYFNVFIEAFVNSSRITGQHPLELWYKDYEDPFFVQNLERVMTQLKEFYKEIHAYVRYVLHQKYGELIVTQNGPLPQHLVDQVLVQAWKKNSLISHPYPNKRLPNVKHELDEHKMNAKKIIEAADEFYLSLGFPELSRRFWFEHTKVKPREEHLGDCKSTVYDFIPDGALEYCPQSNYKKFLQAHRDLGLLHYVNQERHLPYAFYDSYNFEYGVGEAVILSASSPKHIKRIGLLPEFDYDDERNLNRLFRLALHTMFNLANHFVQSKILADIFAGTANYWAPNTQYWKLMEEWAGIEPPVNRRPNDFDFSNKFYENLEENHQTRKFVAEILGYQFYRTMCYISGEYNPRNINYPLNNCDFYDKKEVGNVLKSMMAMGSSKSWREVLASALGNGADLSGDSLLEYFEPVYRWVKEQNDRHGVYRGWTKSQKIISF